MPNRTLLAASTVLILGLAVLLIPQSLHMVPSVQAATKTLSLTGSFSGWNFSQPSGSNPTITVAQGDVVIMQLTSAGGTHQFSLDVDKDGTSFTGACSTGDRCSPVFSSTSSVTINVDFAPGTYTYFCTFHTMMVGSFVVQPPPPSPDYSVTPNPTSESIRAGSTGTSTITLASLNGFSGTISLTSSVAPTGPTVSFNPTSVPISTGSRGTSTLTVSTIGSPAGNYTVTIMATNGTLPHTATLSVAVTVPDFRITASPASLSITQNSTSMSTITLSSLNGFSGALNLTATITPSGPTLSFSTKSVTLSSGGTAQSTLTVSTVVGAYNAVATGSYSIAITVTNGTLSHSKTIQATVSAPVSPAPPLPLTVLATAGVIVMVAVAVTVFLVRRGRPGTQAQSKP